MKKTEFELVHPNAGAIDIGSQNHHVTADGENVKVFETFTDSLDDMIKYFKVHEVTSVAMEATGVYWMNLYDRLEEAGLEVYLVNAAHAKNVPAQKSDFKDCRWLHKLHRHGFLKKSFIPNEIIRKLRTFVRKRETLVDESTRSIQQMQKAYEKMNIKLQNVLSSIKTKSGLRITEAIIAGERKPSNLVKLLDSGISKEKYPKIKKSLKGIYKDEYIFLLELAYDKYKFIREQIEQCDKEIEKYLKEITDDLPKPPKSKAQKSRHNHPEVDGLHDMMSQLLDGRDATVLPALNDKTLLKLLGELGTDLSNFPTAAQFASWANLSPWKNQSGKMNRNKMGPKKSRVGQIFREAAQSVSNSKYMALKGFYNRIKSRSGHKTAIKATARKIAVYFYNFIVHGIEYVEKGIQEYEADYQEKRKAKILKDAKKFGLELTEA